MDDRESVARVTGDLQRIFVWLAKSVLKERPRDVEQFCAEKLARRRAGLTADDGMGLVSGISGCEDVDGKVGDDDLAEFKRDVIHVRKESMPARGAFRVREPAYLSSDEDEDEDMECVRVIAPLHDLTGDGSDGECSDDLAATKLCKVRSVPDDEGVDGPRSHHPPVCALFARNGLSDTDLDTMAERLVDDEWMRSLFRAWDGDNSGAIDFVELVMALHKFEGVGKRGIDIQVAADALVEFVESDAQRELELPQFAKVIVVFARNNFGQEFEAVAEYMLEVATSTSEAAVLHKAAGIDVREIEAIDKEELEQMRETAECVSVNVENNIARMRTTRGVSNAMRRMDTASRARSSGLVEEENDDGDGDGRGGEEKVESSEKAGGKEMTVYMEGAEVGEMIGMI